MTDTVEIERYSDIDDFIVVAVGASAGGFEALTRMFSQVPAGVPAAFVVIQHLDPDHDSIMADLLNRKTELDVRQASHSETLLPGTIYLIPPGMGLRIHSNRLYLVPFAEPRGIRRPIDDFFLSLAEEGNHNCAGVILSGTGADGSMGAQAIKEMGGIVIAQNPEEAKYDGMPRAAIQTGSVDRVLDTEQIVSTLLRIFAPKTNDTLERPIYDINAHIVEICHILREQTGHDFSGYKRPTLMRRIERRMQLLGIETPVQYIRYLQDSSEESHSLFRDVLINVTRFFRDVGNFEILARRAIDPMIASAASGEAVRIWIPGCSSGEEAYTIAMICIYAAERYNVAPRLQIFATDIDEASLSQARLGRYPLSVLQDIPEPYRSRYLDISSKDLQIAPRVRDTIRFSSHNLIRDPAFSRMDLISCRNLFIYFNDKIQRTVLPLMHFSLKPSGYLFLGPSESIGEHENLFASIDRQARLFRKRDVPSSYPVEFVSNGLQSRPVREQRNVEQMSRSGNPMLDVSIRRILETYAPATVTVNDRGEIVASSGKLARYFEFSGHQGRELVISVARPGLRDVLGPLLRTAQSERTRVLRPNVAVNSEFGVQNVEVIADPLTDGHTLIVFNQKLDFEPSTRVLNDPLTLGDERMHYLEDELQQIRLRLRSTVEELETANEELKSSNEEMMSMNEELQSTNEELTTANDELKIKIDQLDILNSDLRNFFESADLGVVILDYEMRVRAYTPRIRNLFPLREADKGRHIGEIATPIPPEDFMAACQSVILGGPTVERMLSVKATDNSYLMRIMPYVSYNGQIDGVTMTFLDISELKASQDRLLLEQQRLSLALMVGNAGDFELDRANRSIRIDEQSRNLIGLPDVAHNDWMVDYATFLNCIHPDQHAEVETAFQKAFNQDESAPFDLILRINDPQRERWIRIISNGGTQTAALCQDYTEQRQIEFQHQILLREMNHRIKNVFSVLSSIIRLSKKNYTDPATFAEDTLERIAALARANMATQDVTSHKGSDLDELFRILLEPYAISQVDLSGPHFKVTSSTASSLSLVVHEWATNACKYGAFAHQDGHLKVEWDVYGNETNGELEIRWTESLPADSMVEPVLPDPNHGFGAKLVAIATQQLQGELKSEFTENGFCAKLRLPLN